jgi:UDP-2-acetamido-3-amino-2,3-dideoxy-glucuronate N-acetyltransferase
MNFYIHPTSLIDENVQVGDGTKIWAFSHISTGAKIGKNCTIGEGVHIGSNVIIGDNCKIQNHSLIYEGVEIGNNVFIGPNVVTTNDYMPKISSDWKHRFKKTLIKDNSSIGANSTIICGIILEENTFIGAGSVVTKNTNKNSINYGNPSRFIRNNF